MSLNRIAVLGGGMASLTAVYELTRDPDWRKNYEITVYQQGFRLGGKGASGINLGRHKRIEEHGLHLLFGWYENVFRMMRETYTELTNDSDAWLQGFVRFDGDITMRDYGAKPHEFWPVQCPHNEDLPGDGSEPRTDPLSLAKKALQWAVAQAGGAFGNVMVTGTAVDTLGSYLDGLPEDSAATTEQQLSRLVELSDAAQISLQTQGFQVESLRRQRIVIALMIAMGRGLIADLALRRNQDWFSLDEHDLRGWLRMHGATEDIVASAPVLALYDAVFSAYSTVGAGTILQALLRGAFTWRGSAIWRFNGGMGDVMFAPLYQVLKARGVQFKFFHRVERLELSQDRRSVQAIVFDRQAQPHGDYDPLLPEGRFGRWPTHPRFEQLDLDPLELGDRELENWWSTRRGEKLIVERGSGFNTVLLGISIAALEEICKPLVRDPNNPRFAEMVRGVMTTQTRAVQLWFTKTNTELGWQSQCNIPYDEPYDTVCSMQHVLEHEPGSRAAGAKALAYLCAALDDDEMPAPRFDTRYPARQLERARQQAETWLSTSGSALWPGARNGSTAFDWSVLLDPSGASGAARLNAQYVNVPVNPSDRYVLIAQNSHRHRLRADEAGYDNLVLAGDWTKTALSGGYLESAAMGGMQAARAIEPSLRRAVGDWLPDASPRSAPAAAARAFVPRDGDHLSKAPFDLDLTIFAFVLRADIAQLQESIDEQLQGGNRSYRVLGPFVTAYIARSNIHAPRAKVPTLDFGFWIPLLGVDGSGSSHLTVFTPYLWADNSWALVGGREVFGFPKQLGVNMRLPNFESDPAFFSLDSMILKSSGGTASIEQLYSVVRLDAPQLGPLKSGVSSWLGLINSLGSSPLIDLLSTLTAGQVMDLLGRRAGMSQVFLKQFPDASADPRGCSYSALVEATIDLLGDTTGGRFEGRYEMRLKRCVSHQIRQTLGLQVNNSQGDIDHLDVLDQFWMRGRARLSPGTLA